MDGHRMIRQTGKHENGQGRIAIYHVEHEIIQSVFTNMDFAYSKFHKHFNDTVIICIRECFLGAKIVKLYDFLIILKGSRKKVIF